MNTRVIVTIVALLVSGVICLAICCGGGAFWAFRNVGATVSPEVDRIFGAIDNDTVGQLYDTDTSSEFQKGVTREQFIELGRTIKTRLGPLKSKSLARFFVSQTNATQFADVTYNATFERGAGTIAARFKHDGDRWVVVNLHVNSPEFQKDLATAKCPYCGAPHAASANFCPKCGKAIIAPPESAPPEPASPADEDK